MCVWKLPVSTALKICKDADVSSLGVALLAAVLGWGRRGMPPQGLRYEEPAVCRFHFGQFGAHAAFRQGLRRWTPSFEVASVWHCAARRVCLSALPCSAGDAVQILFWD